MVDPLRREESFDLSSLLRRVDEVQRKQRATSTAAAATAAKVDKTQKQIKGLQIKSSDLISQAKTIGRTLTQTGIVIGAQSILPTIFDQSSTVGTVASFLGSVGTSALIGGPVVGLLTAIGGTASLAVGLIRSEIQRRETAEKELQDAIRALKERNTKIDENLRTMTADLEQRILFAFQQVESRLTQQVYGLASTFTDKDLLGA